MRKLQLITFVVLALAIGVVSARQAPVSQSDLTRLETSVAEIAKQTTTLEKTDATLAADVKKSLGTLEEDLTYLRVKLRREGSITRAEYSELRDKLETLRVKSLGPEGSTRVTAQPVFDEPRVYTVPVGTQLDARLQNPLNSGTVKLEQRFEATTLLDYKVNDLIVIPAGSILRGFVSSVRAAGKVERRGAMTLSFDEIRIGTRSQKLRASVEQALDGKAAQDNTRIGAGAVAGAIIGGLLGGGKGALVGVLVGAGGTMASTEGSDVDLPVGTILRIRVDQPLDLNVGR